MKRVSVLLAPLIVAVVCLPVFAQAPVRSVPEGEIPIGASMLAQAPVRIVTKGEMDTRIPIAVPDCVAAPGLEALAREMADVLRFDLRFTGLFRLLSTDQYPPNFTGFGPDASGIDFGAWHAAKAEHLGYVYITLQGDELTAQCRLFDTLTGTQVVGQLFTTNLKFPRLVAHRFAEEIVRSLDGIPCASSSEICFSASTGGNKEIFVADYDGANVLQVTDHKSISIMPKFSPDGMYIAYLSYKDRYPFLYIFDRRTGVSEPLSKNVGLNAAPAWAPDGNQLALVLSKDGNTEVYLKNRDGGGMRRLTNDKASDTSPTFSPDGPESRFRERQRRPPPDLCHDGARGKTFGGFRIRAGVRTIPPGRPTASPSPTLWRSPATDSRSTSWALTARIPFVLPSPWAATSRRVGRLTPVTLFLPPRVQVVPKSTRSPSRPRKSSGSRRHPLPAKVLPGGRAETRGRNGREDHR